LGYNLESCYPFPKVRNFKTTSFIIEKVSLKFAIPSKLKSLDFEKTLRIYNSQNFKIIFTIFEINIS